jgi:predicted DCC family thiol-disulfide oxidoreductase YuxK
MINKHLIILFDGVCNFCNFWVNFLIDKDKKDRFRFTALQSEKGKELLTKFNLAIEDFDTFVLIDGDKYYIKSTAALRIAKDLPGLWKILHGFIIIPKPIRDFAYSLVAKNRYKLFGRQETCRIPTPEEKSRFLI